VTSDTSPPPAASSAHNGVPRPDRELPAEPADLTVTEAVWLLQRRELSARELLGSCLRRIDQRNGSVSFGGDADSVNAWIRLYPEDASNAAARADERLRGGDAPPLTGVPLGLKDLYAVAGKPVTASSKVMPTTPATRSCLVWEHLERAGMVLVGHTHTHEFACGGTTDQTGNPWDLRHSPGGSSGGSGAALAAGMVPAATGTDTLGSLRIPSSYCGVSTIKPTRTLVPIQGVVPCATTLDHCGPMARTLMDVAVLLPAMAGADPTQAPTALHAWPQWRFLTPRPSGRPLEGNTVLVSPRTAQATGEVTERMDAVAALLDQLGARVVDGVGEEAPPAFDQEHVFDIMAADIFCYHEQFTGKLDLYRKDVADTVRLGMESPAKAHHYARWQDHRGAVTAAWSGWFAASGVDFVVEPTMLSTAVPRAIGDQPGDDVTRFELLTCFWDYLGFPATSLPAGLGGDSGLPVGVSLIGPAGSDQRVLQASIDLQAHLGIPIAPPAA
jgi:aspartyl-tRNA(Asn)/glutamyl-tRNA(Gln) amidotransferase subunit A